MARLSAFCFLALLAGPALAQDDVAMEGTLPDTLVITASRGVERARLAGRRVAVWTARDLAALPVTSVDELLRTVGGVEVQSRGGFGVQSDLTMRGSGFNGVLILLDGERLNDPMTGHFLSDIPVPLGALARVEVLRGPATALYGPDALGGVIQLFTYAGLHDEGTSGREGDVGLVLGRHGLYDGDAAFRFAATPQTLVTAAAALQGALGQPIIDANGAPVQDDDGRVRADFRRQAYTVAAARTRGARSLYARAGIDDRAFGAYHFYTPFPSDTAREATRTYWAQAHVGGGTATRWQLRLHAKQHEDRYVYNPQTPANEHTSRRLGTTLQATRAFGPVVVTGGAQAAWRGIDSNNLGTHDDASAGAFLSGRWNVRPAFVLAVSARLDYDPGFGTEVTPQVRLAYDLGAVVLRTAVGRAVRAPNYVERYFNTTLARLRGRSVGNPDLDAERAWSYEAGLDLYPAPGLALHATAFARDTDNLIDYVQLSPADTVFLARNLLSVQTRGLEADLDARRDLGTVRLRITGTYTYLDAHLGDVAEGVTYKYALTQARHLVQGTLAATWQPVTLSAQALWKDRLVGDSYGVVNLRLAYQAPLGRQRLTLTGEVRNLFDVRYTDVFDAPMPERWWLVGARLAL